MSLPPLKAVRQQPNHAKGKLLRRFSDHAGLTSLPEPIQTAVSGGHIQFLTSTGFDHEENSMCSIPDIVYGLQQLGA